jgi:hypothetical protein
VKKKMCRRVKMNEEISHGERKDQAQTSKEKKPIE